MENANLGELQLLRLEVAMASGPILLLDAARCNAESSTHSTYRVLFDVLNVDEG